ncbi:unnamed protein product [Lepeophtheirus salmonis]|uniref:(salmon louse) hypothetical protein n=1 Tax=Lepeophtheirus salmonis TaxID=72036 RepID=A0A7R8CDE1_LEPSM|nr:unnamed protein product [Lepeophtheirus salmonis]CAF2775832.1 unnamed protein product [Lepeophtheirus salmonis]
MVESRRVRILSKKPHGSFLLANIHRHNFNDVLLLCSGGPTGEKTFISSHRIILSSISPLLAAVLTEYSAFNHGDHEHPIVISLPDTDPKVMNFLLDFAYSGKKTTVPLKYLDGISETSKRLRIKYLENAIVKVERAPESLALFKSIKSPAAKKIEVKPLKEIKSKLSALVPHEQAPSAPAPAPPPPVFQPRKRTTKIRKVLIPKCTKGSTTTDLPIVDLEECKSEVLIKNDGSQVQVLRHPSSGLILQPVSQIPTHKESNHEYPIMTEQEILPQAPLTPHVGYQGSRVLVQKSRSITLNHDGEEIIHCDKDVNCEEYEGDHHHDEYDQDYHPHDGAHYVSNEEEIHNDEVIIDNYKDVSKEVVELDESFEETIVKDSEKDNIVTSDIIKQEEVHDDDVEEEKLIEAEDVEDVVEEIFDDDMRDRMEEGDELDSEEDMIYDDESGEEQLGENPCERR